MISMLEEILNNKEKIITITDEDSVSDAISLMLEHDFSQLPIVNKDGFLLGMITYQSIIQGACFLILKVEELNVRDAMISNIRPFYIEDNLYDLLDEIKKNNAVVVTEGGGIPMGILTSYDSVDLLRERAEGMMRVENIENTIKAIILASYSDKEEKIDEKSLRVAVQDFLSTRDDQQKNRGSTTFYDLTLNDYIILLAKKRTWDFCEPILKIQRSSLQNLLSKVRETRNDLFHFRKEISMKRMKELIYCEDLLERRFSEYSEENKRRKIIELLEGADKRKSDSDSNAVKKHAKRISVYAAFADWLKARKESEVTLTFNEIEEIIHRKLPDSALDFQEWWANDRVGHTHSKLWLDAGWEKDSVNLKEKWARFIRIIP